MYKDEELTIEELRYFLQKAEQRIEEIKLWIKIQYSEYEVLDQQAIDTKSVALSQHLEYYYEARKHKDEYLELLYKKNIPNTYHK